MGIGKLKPRLMMTARLAVETPARGVTGNRLYIEN